MCILKFRIRDKKREREQKKKKIEIKRIEDHRKTRTDIMRTLRSS